MRRATTEFVSGRSALQSARTSAQSGCIDFCTPFTYTKYDFTFYMSAVAQDGEIRRQVGHEFPNELGDGDERDGPTMCQGGDVSCTTDLGNGKAVISFHRQRVDTIRWVALRSTM